MLRSKLLNLASPSSTVPVVLSRLVSSRPPSGGGHKVEIGGGGGYNKTPAGGKFTPGQSRHKNREVRDEHYNQMFKLKKEAQIRTIAEWKADKVKKTQAVQETDVALQTIEEVESVEEQEERTLHWHNYQRNRSGHSRHGPWLYRYPRRHCWTNARMSGSACPCCRAKWIPSYKDEILKDYINPVSMKVLPQSLTQVCTVKQRMLKDAVLKAQSYGVMKPSPSKSGRLLSDRDIYGKYSSQLYGASQVYHKAYRHLPGNIYYEKDNEYWGHHKVTVESQNKDFIDYE